MLCFSKQPTAPYRVDTDIIVKHAFLLANKVRGQNMWGWMMLGTCLLSCQ